MSERQHTGNVPSYEHTILQQVQTRRETSQSRLCTMLEQSQPSSSCSPGRWCVTLAPQDLIQCGSTPTPQYLGRLHTQARDAATFNA